MAVADINTIANALDAALEISDWAGALTQALRLQARLLATPDSRMQFSDMTWDRGSLKDLISTLRQRVNAMAAKSTGGIKRTNIVYVNPANECD